MSSNLSEITKKAIEDGDIQKHYCNILAPNKDINELLQSSIRFPSPRKESKLNTLSTLQNEPQYVAPELVLSDLSSKKSNRDPAVHLNSTLERVSQDAGYFATGKGEVCVNLKIT